MLDIKGVRLTRSGLGGAASLGDESPVCQTGPRVQDGYQRGPVVGHPGPRWHRPAGQPAPDRPGLQNLMGDLGQGYRDAAV